MLSLVPNEGSWGDVGPNHSVPLVLLTGTNLESPYFRFHSHHHPSRSLSRSTLKTAMSVYTYTHKDYGLAMVVPNACHDIAPTVRFLYLIVHSGQLLHAQVSWQYEQLDTALNCASQYHDYLPRMYFTRNFITRHEGTADKMDAPYAVHREKPLLTG